MLKLPLTPVGEEAVRREVQVRQLCHFARADEDYGRRVAEALGIDVSEFMEVAPATV